MSPGRMTVICSFLRGRFVMLLHHVQIVQVLCLDTLSTQFCTIQHAFARIEVPMWGKPMKFRLCALLY